MPIQPPNHQYHNIIISPSVEGLTPLSSGYALTPSPRSAWRLRTQSLEQKQSLSGSWHKDHSHTYNTSSRIKSSIRDRRSFKASNYIHVASSPVNINQQQQPHQQTAFSEQQTNVTPIHSPNHPKKPTNQQIPARIRA